MGSAEFVEIVLTALDEATEESSGTGTEEKVILPVTAHGVPARRNSLVLALNRKRPIEFKLMTDVLYLIAGVPCTIISSTDPAVHTEAEPGMNVVEVRLTNIIEETL